MGWYENWRKWYIPQLKRNLISVGALETLGLGVSIRDDVLKMTKGSMVVMKDVHRNNLYYLKGSTVTSPMETFISLDDIFTQVWHMRLKHGGKKSLQAPAKKGSLEGAYTCNIEFGGHSVLDKKTKVKFSTSTHRSKGLLDFVHVSIWGPGKTTSLRGHRYFLFYW